MQHLKAVHVRGQIFDRTLSHTAVHGGFGNRRSYLQKHAIIKWLWNNVIGAKVKMAIGISGRDAIGHIFTRQFRQSFYRCKFHFFVNLQLN